MSHFDPSKFASREPPHGLVAEFDAVGPFMAACAKVRDAGVTRWDAHSPFPVHGLDQAMGIKRTRLPWAILLCALLGGSGGILLEWWTNAVDYPFMVSGKPLFSLPAFIPVGFELTVLLSGFCAFFGSLWLNKLPRLFSPLDLSERFRRATDDRFFIVIEGRDPLFDPDRVKDLLTACRPLSLELVEHDAAGPGTRWPRATRGLVGIAVALSLVPLALIARAREVPNERPRIHIIPDDMDNQYKFKEQARSGLFADGRAMRPPPDGTVAHEQPVALTGLHTGKDADGAWLTHIPGDIPLNEATMQRGKMQFNAFCAPCHGLSANGEGPVHRRADSLQEGTWVQPSNMHEARVRAEPVGELYNVVKNGVRNMPGYGHLVELEDRWAIVMYVRALQLSQHAPREALPEDLLHTLH